MCGRFALFIAPGALADLVGVGERELPPWHDRYNIAPTQAVPIVRACRDASREVVLARWGLVPSWAKEPGDGLINARAETVATKPAFRAAFKTRRCLIPASGFYEWAKTGRRKEPYFIRRADDRPLAFAGLWERRVPPEGQPLESCTILTTEANAVMAPIHNRMPVVLEPDAFPRWLGEAAADRDALQTLLRPAEVPLVAVPVSPYVNAPAHDDPRCVDPVTPRS